VLGSGTAHPQNTVTTKVQIIHLEARFIRLMISLSPYQPSTENLPIIEFLQKTSSEKRERLSLVSVEGWLSLTGY